MKVIIIFCVFLNYTWFIEGRVGAVGEIRYEEIFRDPDDADPGKVSVCNYAMSSLLPGASYCFRLRALNGYGSRFAF